MSKKSMKRSKKATKISRLIIIIASALVCLCACAKEQNDESASVNETHEETNENITEEHIEGYTQKNLSGESSTETEGVTEIENATEPVESSETDIEEAQESWDDISNLSDAQLDETIEEILNLMYPERTDVFFAAAAERENPDDAEEYKNALAENFAENNEQTKQYIRDYVDDCIAEGETKADVVKRLSEWSETYPQLTDEQEENFNERYWYYDDLYVQQTGVLKKDTISNDVLAVSLYYDELGMGDKEICVAFAVDVNTATKLVDTEWKMVDNGDWIFVWDDADNPMEYCYGWVTASDILELIEENQIPPTVYLCDEKQINYIDTTYLNNYSKGISFRVQEENRIGYIIQHTEEGDVLGFIGAYDY